VFYVNSNGKLSGLDVNCLIGVRPVINLQADTQISNSNGTLENPYVIL